MMPGSIRSAMASLTPAGTAALAIASNSVRSSSLRAAMAVSGGVGDGTILSRSGRLEGGTVVVSVRELAEALGYTVTPHLERNRVYITPPKPK